MTDDKPGKGIKGEIVGPEPKDEREHFIKCPECGQYFDCRELEQVLHHAEPGHGPFPTN